MPRLIDADELNWGRCPASGKLVGDWLAEAPTIEAEPVRHGRWDDTGRYTFADGSLAIRCTECGAALHLDEWEKYFWNYCPICGAKMDGGCDK